jgi:hypothetical protein
VRAAPERRDGARLTGNAATPDRLSQGILSDVSKSPRFGTKTAVRSLVTAPRHRSYKKQSECSGIVQKDETVHATYRHFSSKAVSIESLQECIAIENRQEREPANEKLQLRAPSGRRN